MNSVKVLDHGEISLFSVSCPLFYNERFEDYDPGDPEVIPVNTARVSYGNSVEVLSEKDLKLLHYLRDHNHTSPYRHIYVGFRCKMPEVCARQFYKHIVGSEYTFKDNPWNEISGRYVEIKEEFYVPELFGKQPDKKAQGSIGYLEGENLSLARENYQKNLENAKQTYQTLLNLGVSREHARLVLPISFYTEFIWTASLQAVEHFIKLRDDDHAQWEIRQYAIAMRSLMASLLPNLTNIFINKGE